MRIIIMGCGRVGAALANMLVAEQHEVTVVDQSTQAFARLGSSFAGKKLPGNGLDEDVLRRAGIERADCFIAVTNGDNRNIMAAQVAKHSFRVPRVICRIYDPIRQQVYSDLGLESICPTTIGAELIHDAVLHPERSLISAALSIAEGRSVPTRPLPHDAPPTSPPTPSPTRGGNAGRERGGAPAGQAPSDVRRQGGIPRR
jgi:trk system potassium uptake protein TrkA